MSDPLQLCPVENWPELEDVFRSDWPRGISVVMLLQMQRYILQCGLNYECKVYTPYGNAKYGLVAINTKKGLYEVIVQCPNDDTSKLEDALKTTSIIDWKKEIEIPFAPKHIMIGMERVIEKKNISIQNIIPATAYILDNTASLFNVALPSGFRFELLSLKYVDLLETTWPHRFENCSSYFEFIIKAKLGYGLFKENQLVSWTLVRESGCLLHLYTLQEERRKGYGEMVLKLISNVLLKDGKYVVAFCKSDNINAAKLYQKLNFQQINDFAWCTLASKLIN